MAWKTGRILGPLLFGIMTLALRATGQESVYSADSLMDSFEEGSKVSPKGTQITFRDVVVESEDDKVTFKSSHNKRAICKLVPSSEHHKKLPSVGSDVTVIGKVRGRGLPGNVTLDNCTVAPLNAVVADTEEVTTTHQPIFRFRPNPGRKRSQATSRSRQPTQTTGADNQNRFSSLEALLLKSSKKK
jgi:hypothetical protein